MRSVFFRASIHAALYEIDDSSVREYIGYDIHFCSRQVGDRSIETARLPSGASSKNSPRVHLALKIVHIALAAHLLPFNILHLSGFFDDFFIFKTTKRIKFQCPGFCE